MNTYAALGFAIVAEVFATAMLKMSDGLSRPIPAGVSLLGYAISFYFLAQTLRTLPTGIAYAIWSGAGIVLVSLVGWLFLKQRLDLPAIFGMALIVAGVLVINLFSKASAH